MLSFKEWLKGSTGMSESLADLIDSWAASPQLHGRAEVEEAYHYYNKYVKYLQSELRNTEKLLGESLMKQYDGKMVDHCPDGALDSSEILPECKGCEHAEVCFPGIIDTNGILVETYVRDIEGRDFHYVFCIVDTETTTWVCDVASDRERSVYVTIDERSWEDNNVTQIFDKTARLAGLPRVNPNQYIEWRYL